MSMNHDPEDFDSLRKLLVLKRYEQPPPRYFNDFSSQVIARIERGEAAQRGFAFESLLWDAPWLQRIWAAFEAKPVLAGIFGVALCTLMISGVVYSDQADVPPVALIPVAEGAAVPVEVATVSAADHPLLAKPSPLESSSTNPVGAEGGPLFGNFGRLQAQPASFVLPGRN